MKIGIMAASGQLGGAILKATVAEIGSERVVGFARTPEKAAGLGVEIRPGDYTDRAALTRGFADLDAVLLVSGNSAPEARIPQHRCVIESAASAGVEKLVYTSVQGPEADTGFSAVVNSNRQTEADVRASGLQWAIGRNGIYIEPDIEYLDHYRASGEIVNCAGEGRCGYTTRDELAAAYAKLLLDDARNGQTYNLHGEELTQAQLAERINRHFGTALRFRDLSVDDYRAERVEALGDHLGPIIAGIYAGIRIGSFDSESHYEQATGRPHKGWDEVFQAAARAV